MFTKRKKDRLISLPLGVIHPSSYQARVEFDSSALEELADSIKRNGLLQPVVVRRRADGSYELVAGERRLRAARLAGLREIPCVEKQLDNKKAAVLGLIENLQRQDLNMFEEAEGIRQLMDEWGMSQYDCSVRLGKAQSTISNKLRLLRFSRADQQRILDGGLSERQARALLRLDSASQRAAVLDKVIENRLSITETEQLVDRLLSPPEPPTPVVRTTVINDLRVYLNTLSKTVESIRRAGLNAKSNETETEDYIEYTIILPKNKNLRL